MRKKTSTSHSFIVALITGLLLLLFLASIFLHLIDQQKQERVRRIALIPKTFTLEVHTQLFATASATLISEQSLSDYAPTLGPLDSLLQLLIPMRFAPNPYDATLLTLWIDRVASETDIPSTAPSVQKVGKSIQINPGAIGHAIDKNATRTTLQSIDSLATTSARASYEPIGKELGPDAIISSEERAKKYLGKTITLQSKNYKQILKDSELYALFDLPTGFSQDALRDLAHIVDTKVMTTPVEPTIVVNGRDVTSFTAPKDGIGLDAISFIPLLEQTITDLPESTKPPTIDLPLIRTSPSQKLSELNSLGISERIGVGESDYHHSIPNRIFNVSLTTSKIHSKLILPGEEFSFNAYLGDVSSATGFKQAYVIKQGQTVLGDGGGVCQVSTTLFRALLDAGLPITERRGHAYRVGYYEQNSRPGFDATVYGPHPDLRFVNDTGNAILINAVADAKNLSMYIELWGTSDGRKEEVTNYRQWDAVPALPTVYQDDPSLPPGHTKQIDYAAPGLKTAFDYIVTYPDGSVKKKSFQTTYAPWAAVYLRGI